MSSTEPIRGSEENFGHSAGSHVREQFIEESGCDAEFRSPVRGLNEHLPQRAPALADVAQTDRANQVVSDRRDPEAAAAASVEALDIEEVRLIIGCDVEAEFIALNGNDQLDYTGLPRTPIRRDDHGLR